MGGNRAFVNTSNSTTAPVTLTAGAAITIVNAGAAGQTTKLLYLYLAFSIAGTIQIAHGSTNWTGITSVATGTPYILDLHDHPWITNAAEGITITTVTAVGAGSVEFVTGNN